MEDMIAFLDRLDLADLVETEPLYQVLPEENVFREDVVVNEAVGGSGELPGWLAENAPCSRGEFFAVPRTTEG